MAMFNSIVNRVNGEKQSFGEGVAVVLKGTFGVEQLQRIAVEKVSRISNDAERRPHDLKSFYEALTVLASLSLTQGDFALVSRRLDNAWRYFQTGEWGAGRYELTLLEKSLKNGFA